MQRLSLPLLVTAIMTPQILETLYSPALTAIRSDFGISAAQAGQTLSIYFFAFALGVAFWGAFCDRFGRRPAMLAGLALYLVGAGIALLSGSFTLLLAARALIAFGAAVGSIVTQTMLRDVYQGPALGRMFALVGIALSISPLLGMFAGGGAGRLGRQRGDLHRTGGLGAGAAAVALQHITGNTAAADRNGRRTGHCPGDDAARSAHLVFGTAGRQLQYHGVQLLQPGAVHV